MSDREIIAGLIARDESITADFFFMKCRPLFCCIMQHVFRRDVDYNDMVNELYVYLMEDDAAKLRAFRFSCSVYQWLKVLAIRFFLKRRDKMMEVVSHEVPCDGNETIPEVSADVSAQSDIEHLLGLMPNARYARVIRLIVLDGAPLKDVAVEMGVTVDNLYNIKRRAIAQLTRIALKNF